MGSNCINIGVPTEFVVKHRPSSFVYLPDGVVHEIKKPNKIKFKPEIKPAIPAVYQIAERLGIECESGFDKNGNWLYTKFKSDADQKRAHAEQNRLHEGLNTLP